MGFRVLLLFLIMLTATGSFTPLPSKESKSLFLPIAKAGEDDPPPPPDPYGDGRPMQLLEEARFFLLSSNAEGALDKIWELIKVYPNFPGIDPKLYEELFQLLGDDRSEVRAKALIVIANIDPEQDLLQMATGGVSMPAMLRNDPNSQGLLLEIGVDDIFLSEDNPSLHQDRLYAIERIRDRIDRHLTPTPFSANLYLGMLYTNELYTLDSWFEQVRAPESSFRQAVGNRLESQILEILDTRPIMEGTLTGDALSERVRQVSAAVEWIEASGLRPSPTLTAEMIQWLTPETYALLKKHGLEDLSPSSAYAHNALKIAELLHKTRPEFGPGFSMIARIPEKFWEERFGSTGDFLPTRGMPRKTVSRESLLADFAEHYSGSTDKILTELLTDPTINPDRLKAILRIALAEPPTETEPLRQIRTLLRNDFMLEALSLAEEERIPEGKPKRVSPRYLGGTRFAPHDKQAIHLSEGAADQLRNMQEDQRMWRALKRLGLVVGEHNNPGAIQPAPEIVESFYRKNPHILRGGLDSNNPQLKRYRESNLEWARGILRQATNDPNKIANSSRFRDKLKRAVEVIEMTYTVLLPMYPNTNVVRRIPPTVVDELVAILESADKSSSRLQIEVNKFSNDIVNLLGSIRGEIDIDLGTLQRIMFDSYGTPRTRLFTLIPDHAHEFKATTLDRLIAKYNLDYIRTDPDLAAHAFEFTVLEAFESINVSDPNAVRRAADYFERIAPLFPGMNFAAKMPNLFAEIRIIDPGYALLPKDDRAAGEAAIEALRRICGNDPDK